MLNDTKQPAGTHSHRCQDCGTLWSHGDMLKADIEAHTCPKCGKPGQWRKYNGLQIAKPAPVTRHGGGYFTGANRIIISLVAIVVAGCLFAHVIINFIEGDYR